jgi:hypothetical protein
MSQDEYYKAIHCYDREGLLLRDTIFSLGIGICNELLNFYNCNNCYHEHHEYHEHNEHHEYHEHHHHDDNG